MKILFIGDYSNLHACLAKELKSRGHDVTVLSDRGGYMQTHSDIYIPRRPGPIGGLVYLARVLAVLPRLKGYDVVQLINPNFLSLKPAKLRYIFNRLGAQNHSIFLTLAGNDYFFVRECMKGRMFRFSEFRVGDKPTEFYRVDPGFADGWMAEVNRDWNQYVYDRINGAMSVLPEYDMAARPILGNRLLFTNLPIDLSSLPYRPLKIEGPLKIFIGIKEEMAVEKGTARMLAILRELEAEMPGKLIVEVARNLPLNVYLEKLRNSHLVLDQLYSYSPATNALQAMALGPVAGSGAEPEYWQYLVDREFSPAKTDLPIFHLSPLLPDLKERLRALIIDPSPLIRMSLKARKLVERHNDVRVVADRFLAFWQKRTLEVLCNIPQIRGKDESL